jgi:hypothetical protein
MALAMIYPKGWTKRPPFQRSDCNWRAPFLRFGADDLAPRVMSGATSLDEAFGEAQRRRQAVGSDGKARRTPRLL